MFERQLASGLVVQPFAITVSMGSYWLTRLHSRPVTPAMEAFSTWMTSVIAQSDEAGC
jgi:LysR family transcriptional regulator of beta-lactamase